MICRELSSQPRLRRSRLWFVALPVLAATLMVERPTPSAAQGPELRPLASELATSISNSGRKTAAVVDFTDLQGCVTELGRYIAEDLSVALVSDAKGFDVVDRTSLKTILQEHQLASTGIIDPATARKLGQIAGVDALVTGTIAPLGETVHISAKVLDTQSAKILGGYVTDIPRTSGVNAFLTGSTTGCSPAAATSSGNAQPPSSSGNGAWSANQGSQAAGPKDSAVIILNSFRFALRECHYTQDRTVCTGVVTNQGSAREAFSIDTYKTYMVNDLGSQSTNGPGYVGANVQLGADSWAMYMGHSFGKALEPGVPLAFELIGLRMKDGAKTVTIILSTSEGQTIIRDIRVRG